MDHLKKKKVADGTDLWQEGSIGDLLSVGLCILAMIAVMMAFMDCAALVHKKTIISQISRKFILKMETVGYLTMADENELRSALNAEGMWDVDLSGTTREMVGYGGEIVLRIRGKMGEGHVVEEYRMSTAKN